MQDFDPNSLELAISSKLKSIEQVELFANPINRVNENGVSFSNNH